MLVTKFNLRLIESVIPPHIISEFSGVPESRISEYRHGKRSIPIHHVMALCTVLRCEPHDIIGVEEVETV